MKNKVRKILMIFSCLIGLSFTLSAQNPYLPFNKRLLDTQEKGKMRWHRTQCRQVQASYPDTECHVENLSQIL